MTQPKVDKENYKTAFEKKFGKGSLIDDIEKFIDDLIVTTDKCSGMKPKNKASQVSNKRQGASTPTTKVQPIPCLIGNSFTDMAVVYQKLNEVINWINKL